MPSRLALAKLQLHQLPLRLHARNASAADIGAGVAEVDLATATRAPPARRRPRFALHAKSTDRPQGTNPFFFPANPSRNIAAVVQPPVWQNQLRRSAFQTRRRT